MHYLFLLYSHVFLHSLLCLWSKKIGLLEKTYLSVIFFLLILLFPVSFLIPIKSIRVFGFTIKGVTYATLLFQFAEIFIKQEYYTVLKNASFIVDAGANLGMATLYFAKYFPKAKVLSFEPDPDLFLILTENINSNNLSHRVELVQAALGDKNGSVKLYRSDLPGRMTMSIVKDRIKSSNHVMVPVHTLSEHISESVDILKIDIEGAEHEVLDEMEKSDKLKQVRVIVMEYHHIINNSEAAQSLAGFLGKLERAGYNYNLDTFQSPLFPHITQDVLIGASRIW